MSSRAGIHYWKCDRPAVLHGTALGGAVRAPADLMALLVAELDREVGGAPWRIALAAGQGNHLTFLADSGGREWFLRVEDGPEQDDYLAVESEIMGRLRNAGIPVPQVHFCDASRTSVPVAFHLLERIPEPDLNHHLKAGRLDLGAVMAQIGGWIALWQRRVVVNGFGPFDRRIMDAEGRLSGLHGSAAAYFFLNLRRHLDFLVSEEFIDVREAGAFLALLEDQYALLESTAPCLVHKDMAMWNVLGTPSRVTAFIDWDDAIGGDAMEDLSLLACFHPADAVKTAMVGYAAVSALPPDHMRRFWTHLLRNMIVKSVIRVGAGYFDGPGGLFIHGSGADGAALRAFTLARLRAAARGLREERETVAFD
jgi:aminoglycoside phosphotransferase (APT) family kinase protein